MSNDLTLICEVCKFPIKGDTGSIYVRMGDVRDVRDAELARQERRERGPVNAGDLVVEYLTAPRRVHWRTAHDKCRTDHDEGCYEVDGIRITTWRSFCRQTADLMTKNWFPLSDWDVLLRELGGEGEPRRIRATSREAA